MPIGSRIPRCSSTMYSCGSTCSTSRSAGTTTARATSCTRFTSAAAISSPCTATTPLDVRAWMYSPATPVKTRSHDTPAISSASFIAARTESVVPSMSVTTSRRMPPVFDCPTPSTLIDACPFTTLATSAMTAHVFVEPISRPATRFARVVILSPASLYGRDLASRRSGRCSVPRRGADYSAHRAHRDRRA